MNFDEVLESMENYIEEFRNYLENNEISYTNATIPQLINEYGGSFEEMTGLSISDDITWIVNNWDKVKKFPLYMLQCLSGAYFEYDDIQAEMSLAIPNFFRLANANVRGNKEIVEELIRRDGTLLSYANLEKFSDDEVDNMFQIAKANGYFPLQFKWGDKNALENYKFIMLNIENVNDGIRVLDLCDFSNMTEQQLKECISKGLSKGWEIDSSTQYEVKNNDIIIPLALKKNGDSFRYLPQEKQTVENFKIALQSGYKMSRLKGYAIDSKELMRTAIEYDGSNINYINEQTISEELLREALKKDRIKFSIEFLNFMSFYPEYDNLLCDYIKRQQYTLDEICEMFKGEYEDQNAELLKCSFMQALMEKLAPLIGRTEDDTKNKMNSLYDGNNKLFLTFDIRLLDKKFESLGDFLIDYISCYEDIEEKIINLSLENRETVLKLIQYVTQNVEYKAEWISVLDDLLIEIDKKEHEVLIEDINNNKNNLNDDTIERLIFYFTRPHVFPINSINDLVYKYNELMSEYCDNKVKNADGIDDIKEAISYKMYGIDYDTLMSWNRMYCQGVNEYEDDEIKEIMKCIKNICDSNDINTLKALYESMPKVETDIYSKYALRTEMRIKCGRELINRTFSPTQEQYIGEKDGVKIYDAGLEFNMFVRAESGYMCGKEPENYEREWNKANKLYPYLSTSYVANNNMGIWEEKNRAWIVYGFCNRNLEKSIIASGTYDLDSQKKAHVFDVTKREFLSSYDNEIPVTFLGPQKCIDETRYIHNETVIALRDYNGEKGEKIQPDYIVYTYATEEIDENDERWKKSIKAAKQFNLPIVTVNRLKIAINERRKIDNIISRISQINSEDELPDFERIIIDFENNKTGMLDSFPNLIEKYFSDDAMKEIIERTCSQIVELQKNGRKSIADKLITRFENVIKREAEIRYRKCPFDAETAMKIINGIKNGERTNIEKSVGDLNE